MIDVDEFLAPVCKQNFDSLKIAAAENYRKHLNQHNVIYINFIKSANVNSSYGDCIFHKSYTTDDDRKSFINWLAALTKDTGYVSLSYMTGVLPIAKYSSGSTINNFIEYTMAAQPKYSECFGFSDLEVDHYMSDT